MGIGLERKKILITDDVELFLMLERTVYNRSKFELIIARGAMDFLKIAKKESPDLIFINEDVPDIRGVECCRIIKDDPDTGTIPVVLVAGTSLEGADIDYNRYGCDDVLFKPIERQELLSLARKYLDVMERVKERIKERLKIRYWVDTEQNLCHSIDLNSGGLFLETDKPVEVDTSIELEFQIPDTDYVIHCNARGAWVNAPGKRKKAEFPPGMGVQFINLSASDRKSIDDYLNGRSPYH